MTKIRTLHDEEVGGRGAAAGVGGGAPTRAPGLAGVLLFAGLFPAAATWLWFVVLAGRPGMQAVYAAAKIVQFALPGAWVFLVERRYRGGDSGAARGARSSPPVSSPGQPSLALTKGGGEARARGILQGLAFGTAASAAILLVYFAGLKGTALLEAGSVEIRAKVWQLGLGTPARFLALALFYSLAHSGLEEYYWRWFVFGRLRRLLPLRASAGLSSLAFTAHHVIVLALYFRKGWEMALLGSAAVWVAGAVWARIYDRGDSLAGPWLSHLLVDGALMFVGYDMLWPIG